MITLYRWNTRTGEAGQQSADSLPRSLTAIGPDELWWIDLENPTSEEEQAVLQSLTCVHPLTLEDITKPRREPETGPHLPKVEEFPDYLFIIVNPLRPGVLSNGSARRRQKAVGTQLSAIITRQMLITHHYDPLPSVELVKQHAVRHSEACSRGPDYLFHLVLDAMVDVYAPEIDRLGDELDQIEMHLFERPQSGVLPKLLRLKRRIITIRKTLILEREVLMRLTRGEFALVDEREKVYYRNVYDHLVRYNELIEAGREMVSDLLQTYLAAMSNRLNAIMKVLAMISTIVLPMTLIAGIYGMNFHQGMPELDWEYGYPFALGLMLLSAIASIALFRWKRWV